MRFDKYTTQVASDIIRDGLGVELLDEEGDIVAEVFRCDASETVTFEAFKQGVSSAVKDQFVAYARERLGTFESGKPLGTIEVLSPNNSLQARRP